MLENVNVVGRDVIEEQLQRSTTLLTPVRLLAHRRPNEPLSEARTALLAALQYRSRSVLPSALSAGRVPSRRKRGQSSAFDRRLDAAVV